MLKSVFKFAAASILLSAQRSADAIYLLGFLYSVQNKVKKLTGNNNDQYCSCDGCFCIPAPGQSCPVDQKPQTNYTSLVSVLQSYSLETLYSLDCDPYGSNPCDTTPFLEEGGACVVNFSTPSDGCPASWSYSLSTYPGTFEEAIADSSVYVTDEGACGTCSSLQDLSVYLKEGANLRAQSTNCGIQGQRSMSAGIACFQNLGFTNACSLVWYYNTKNTAKKCLHFCALFVILNLPPHRHPPQCNLSLCIDCDERQSGPTFKKFAGRTRRNSGLLSSICRPCSDLSSLKQRNPYV